jgi:uncharacterized protein
MDSYALLVFLQKELGWERVKGLFTAVSAGKMELHMSIINLAEVQCLVIRRGKNVTRILSAIEGLPLKIASADDNIPQVVELKAKHPMALAHCFAAALAIELNCPLITGDREFKKLEEILTVEWLG